MAVATGVVSVGAVARLIVGRGRPLLDGDVAVRDGGAPIVIRRDVDGVVDLVAENRDDAAFGTGFVHAQERFFQMDVSRRIAAGELSELFGRRLLPMDRVLRVHRFRHLALQAEQQLDRESRDLLAAYTRGVNAGLAALPGRPLEYLFGRAPSPWRERDTLLVAYSLFVLLQDAAGDQKYHRRNMADVLSQEVADFLAPIGDPAWDAPMLGGPLVAPALPSEQAFSARSLPAIEVEPDCEPGPRRLPNGSNCWAVSGARTPHGGAMLANDMHLGFGMPNPFFRLSLRYGRAPARRVCGFTVPGYPLVVSGSNGDISWGLTNSAGDWCDLIELGPGDDIVEQVEAIHVKGRREPEWLRVRVTRWGPVVRTDPGNRQHALRWVAHGAGAINLDFRHLEEAGDAAVALACAQRSGLPAQNFHVADRFGHIGWTIAGRIPRRTRSYRGAVPSAAVEEWQGWLAPHEYPQVLNPDTDVVWTANSRVTDGDGLEKIGGGFYRLGARAKQIKEALDRMPRATEADFLALQLDYRACFLERWRALLLDVLEALDDRRLNRFAASIRGWSGRASAGCRGYRAVRAFRFAVKALVFEPYVTRVRQVHRDFDVDAVGDQWEAPLWTIVTHRPPHLLPSRFSTWDDALAFAVSAAHRTVTRRWRRDGATWGDYNRLRMRHPLSRTLPFLARWLNMPASPLNGDLHMPLAQIGVHGPVQRMVVAPGREHAGIAHLAGGQAANPRTPYFARGHDAWVRGAETPFLPGPAVYELRLITKPTLAAQTESLRRQGALLVHIQRNRRAWGDLIEPSQTDADREYGGEQPDVEQWHLEGRSLQERATKG
jgi:penicillin amidase